MTPGLVESRLCVHSPRRSATPTLHGVWFTFALSPRLQDIKKPNKTRASPEFLK